MNGSKRVLLLVGSPRGKRSTSTVVGAYLADLLTKQGLESLATQWIGPVLRSQEKTKQMLEAVDAADIIVLAAPLYDDCQPYIAIKAMELISAHKKNLSKSPDLNSNRLFSVIVNCAFPEEHHPQTVIRIHRKFAEDVGFRWGGSLAIRAGEVLQGRKGKTLDDIGSMAKRVKEALALMADSLSKGLPPADQTLCVIPESFLRGSFSFLGSFFVWQSNRHWASLTKKRGKDVNARPFV